MPVLFVVKLWMCLLSDVSTKPSGYCALVPVKPASETSSPSLNVLLMNSSTLPREVPTPTPSRRRTNLNVSPSLTDKMLNAFYCIERIIDRRKNLNPTFFYFYLFLAALEVTKLTLDLHYTTYKDSSFNT